MTQQDTFLAALSASDRRRAERRRFLKLAGAAGATTAGLTLLSACGGDDDDDGGTPTPSPSPSGSASPSPTPSPTPEFAEPVVLNFALQLEYLEATFYARAAFGTDLPDALIGGTGTPGAVTGGRQVTFTDPVVAQYAREIAADEIAHVTYIRNALGGAAVARPAINIDGGTTGAFTAAARAAGVVAPDATFDPYASDENFLLSAFLFEDVGVTAYSSAFGSLVTPALIDAVAGIHAAEAYHAGLIRETLYAKGVATAALRTNAGNISNARDQLDGLADLDQPIAGTADIANVIPVDTAGLVLRRTPAQVLNILFLTRAPVTSGGFFPAGINGTITTSGDND